MIKLIRDNDKFRLMNTEKIFIDSKNEIIFISSDVKFSFCENIKEIGKFDDSVEMVNLFLSDDDDIDFIPIIDTEITRAVFDFLKNEFENITKKYGNILDYIIIESDKTIKNNVYDSNNIIKDVLKVEFEKVFDKWGMKIVYQNFDVLKRNDFNDSHINVKSRFNIEYDNDKNILYILGSDIDEDNTIIVVDDEAKKIIEHKVKLINEKYGIIERWRAEEGDIYFFILNGLFTVGKVRESGTYIDNTRYRIGNYFRTKELAENKVKEIKELLLK